MDSEDEQDFYPRERQDGQNYPSRSTWDDDPNSMIPLRGKTILDYFSKVLDMVGILARNLGESKGRINHLEDHNQWLEDQVYASSKAQDNALMPLMTQMVEGQFEINGKVVRRLEDTMSTIELLETRYKKLEDQMLEMTKKSIMVQEEADNGTKQLAKRNEELEEENKMLRNQVKQMQKYSSQPGNLLRAHCNAIFIEDEMKIDLDKFTFPIEESMCVGKELMNEIYVKRNLNLGEVSNSIEQVQGITLKSGKAYQPPPPKPRARVEEKEVEIEDEKVEEPLLTRRYVTRVPFPQRLTKFSKVDKEWGKFLKVMKQLTVTIPFMDLVKDAPMYGKFIKEILLNKRTIEEVDSCLLSHDCSALLTQSMPIKAKDPGQFTIPCSIGDTFFEQPLADLGASVSVMPISVYRKLRLEGMKSTRMTLHLADGTSKHPHGVIENVPVKVDKFFIPCDFVVLDASKNACSRLIFGRPFLATAKAKIEVATGKLTLEICDEIVEIEPRAQVEIVTENRDKVLLEEVSMISEDTSPKTKKLTMKRLKKLCDPPPSLSFGEQVIESFSKMSLVPSKTNDSEKKAQGNSVAIKLSTIIASKAPD